MFQAVAPRPQIVQQHDVGDIELADERFGFHDPRKICGSHAAIDDRPGDAEAGGIAVKILEKMKDGTFFHAFKDKWKFEGLLSNIPVSIVLNESAPLLGAAYEALAAIDK